MREAPPDNIFGKILKGEIPSTEIYSDNHVYCFLDLFPQNPGHTLVIPRDYSRNVAQDAAVKAATGETCVSVVSYMGREAGQMVDYLHFHVIPRHPDDSVSMYEVGEEQTPEQLAEMAERIKAEL